MITAERIERVLYLKLDTPPVNVFDTASFKELAGKLKEAAADKSIAGVFLSGEGKCFSAGASVEEHEKKLVGDMIFSFTEACRTLYEIPVPSVLLVHGFCFGGALELALYSDFIIEDLFGHIGTHIPQYFSSCFFLPPLCVFVAVLVPFFVLLNHMLQLLLQISCSGSFNLLQVDSNKTRCEIGFEENILTVLPLGFPFLPKARYSFLYILDLIEAFKKKVFDHFPAEFIDWCFKTLLKCLLGKPENRRTGFVKTMDDLFPTGSLNNFLDQSHSKSTFSTDRFACKNEVSCILPANYTRKS